MRRGVFLLQPEIPEEGIKMFIVKKDKEAAMSEEEKLEQELSMALEEHEQNEDEVETPDELSPAGKLAYNIADHLAEVTAERFSEMIDGLDMDIAKQIVRRLRTVNIVIEMCRILRKEGHETWAEAWGDAITKMMEIAVQTLGGRKLVTSLLNGPPINTDKRSVCL